MTTTNDLKKRTDETPRQHLGRLEGLRDASGDDKEWHRINTELIDYGWSYYVGRELDDDAYVGPDE